MLLPSGPGAHPAPTPLATSNIIVVVVSAAVPDSSHRANSHRATRKALSQAFLLIITMYFVAYVWDQTNILGWWRGSLPKAWDFGLLQGSNFAELLKMNKVPPWL